MIYDTIIYIINYKITFVIKFYVPDNFKFKKFYLFYVKWFERTNSRNEKLNIQNY